MNEAIFFFYCSGSVRTAFRMELGPCGAVFVRGRSPSRRRNHPFQRRPIMANRAVGLFDNREEAVRAQRELLRAGFRPNEIELISEQAAGSAGSGPRGLWESLREML